MNAKDLRDVAKEYRLVVDRSLDDAEITKGLRLAATAKGIDWSQLKALVKAQAADARDEGHRVETLVERAEFASAYADMLSANVNAQDDMRSSSDANDPVVTVSTGGASAEMKLSTLGKIAEAAATETGRKVLQGALAAVSAPATLAQTMASEGLISQEHADKAAVLTSAMALRFVPAEEEDVPDFLDRRRPRSAAQCGND